MNWVVYLIKTTVVQMRQDWAEYKQLKQKIDVAIEDEMKAFDEIVRHGKIERWDACIYKNKTIVPGQGKVEQRVRCPSFDVEKPCNRICHSNTKNHMWFKKREQTQNLQMELKRFWRNKFQKARG